jgi:hypothetical protein
MEFLRQQRDDYQSTRTPLNNCASERLFILVFMVVKSHLFALIDHFFIIRKVTTLEKGKFAQI